MRNLPRRRGPLSHEMSPGAGDVIEKSRSTWSRASPTRSSCDCYTPSTTRLRRCSATRWIASSRLGRATGLGRWAFRALDDGSLAPASPPASCAISCRRTVSRGACKRRCRCQGVLNGTLEFRDELQLVFDQVDLLTGRWNDSLPASSLAERKSIPRRFLTPQSLRVASVCRREPKGERRL